MKFEKILKYFCGITFTITFMLLGIIVFDTAANGIISSAALMIVFVSMGIFIALSAICACGLMAYHDDYKWRHLNKNEKWK